MNILVELTSRVERNLANSKGALRTSSSHRNAQERMDGEAAGTCPSLGVPKRVNAKIFQRESSSNGPRGERTGDAATLGRTNTDGSGEDKGSRRPVAAMKKEAIDSAIEKKEEVETDPRGKLTVDVATSGQMNADEDDSSGERRGGCKSAVAMKKEDIDSAIVKKEEVGTDPRGKQTGDAATSSRMNADENDGSGKSKGIDRPFVAMTKEENDSTIVKEEEVDTDCKAKEGWFGWDQIKHEDTDDELTCDVDEDCNIGEVRVSEHAAAELLKIVTACLKAKQEVYEDELQGSPIALSLKASTTPVSLRNDKVSINCTPLAVSPIGCDLKSENVLEEALLYLDRVKLEFSDRPYIYKEFLEVLKNFNAKAVNTVGVISRVRKLFQGYNDLILGFNVLLPKGYKIQMQGMGAGLVGPGLRCTK